MEVMESFTFSFQKKENTRNCERKKIDLLPVKPYLGEIESIFFPLWKG